MNYWFNMFDEEQPTSDPFNAAEDRFVAEDIEKRYQASALCQMFEAAAKRLLPGWGEK